VRIQKGNVECAAFMLQFEILFIVVKAFFIKAAGMHFVDLCDDEYVERMAKLSLAKLLLFGCGVHYSF
jgi:hypothetical protein